ncbi:hypothetical protein [Alysiella crassa]|uniref:Uncharacterized protein n=1 Tax=Alysiella crassa TaxID=153491 RepID=A0A376BM10_9NEIS|nr:hypothetical protein [Alysiella crassa]UOP07164.1 hypothetical protein LVJ80_01495 [Alysiella crassa]SSY70675.1 Uncharacterised protein [Alysiella crassa]
MNVELGKRFQQELKNYPTADKIKIADFILHIQKHGFTGLAGRNKPSHEVPKDDPKWLEKVQYAQQHRLWHYHIGIPEYDVNKPFGEQTSKYVLHYMKWDNAIRIVDFSEHPPFSLPTELYLE